MTIAKVGTGATYDNGGSSWVSTNIAKDTGVAVGDLVLLCISWYENGGDDGVITPTGFTDQGSFAYSGSGTGESRLDIFSRVIDGSEPSSWTVTRVGSPLFFASVFMVTLRGDGALSVASVTAGTPANGTSISAPSVTGATGQGLAAVFALSDPASNHSTPTGMTLGIASPSNTNNGRTFYETLAGNGATGVRTMTWTTSRSAIGVSVLIDDDGAAGTPAPTITDVDEDDTITSDQTDVEIDGSDFDTATVEIRQGSVEVAQSVDSQTATAIVFDVVFEGTSDLKHGAATLAVINQDAQEDTIAITIDAPSGHLYVDIGTPNTTADNRITAVPDIESGDQIEARGEGGGSVPTGLTLNADGTFEFSSGNTPASFDVRIWDVNDATWGAWATQSVVGAIELVVADAAHGHSADNVALVQGHVLSVQGASHGHSADNVALTQAHLLVVQGASHDHAADNIVLTVAGVLDVAGAAHAHTADSVALTQAHMLAVADAVHGHAADSVTLSLGLLLTVADALHSHAVDNVALTQAHVLTVADALHAHSAANVVLEEAQTLSVDDASHGHTAESPTLSLADILSVADAVHEHTADEIELTQSHVLVVSSALHSHLADAISLQIPGYVPPAGRVFIVETPNRTFVVAKGNRTFQA